MARQQYPDDSKVVQVAEGITYAYVYKPAQPNKPTFLLLHGFPSSSYDWRHQITDLPNAGYGVLVPDLLGYGDSSKPTAKEEYAWAKISAHVAKVLDNEGLTKVIGVGHDWGAVLLSRFANYQQQYLAAAIWVAIPYTKNRRFDVKEVNRLTEQYFGYPCYGYQLFFVERGTAELIENNHGSFMSIFYPSDPEIWKTWAGPVGKMKEWVQLGKTTPPASWLSDEELATHRRILLSGGYTGPLNWYVASYEDLDAENRSKVPPENQTINVPALMIAAEKDYICRPEMVFQTAEQGKKEGFLPDVQVKQVKTGHWVQLEARQEFFSLLDEFAKGLLESRARI